MVVLNKQLPVLKRILLFLGLALLGYGIYYIGLMAEVLTGFGAKQLCSCVFVSGRTPSSVLENELNRFPYTLASYEVNAEVGWAGSQLGFWNQRRAAYRKSVGCVLLTDKEQTPAPSSPPVPLLPGTPLPVSHTMAKVDYGQLAKVLDRSFAEPDSSRLQNTKAVVVLYRDTLVAEHYAPGFSPTTRMPGWSMAKSVTSALIGSLVGQGKLSVDDPAPVAVWQNADDGRGAITIDDLLRMRSGLAWNESYFTVSNVTRMLFMTEDMAEVAIQQPLAHPPGTEWYYSSGTTNILSHLIRKTVGDNYLAFPYQVLFNPLGMGSAVWETDLSGTQVGSSYLLATARDWAKFGLLYLHDGVWHGERLLPEGWVDYTATPVAQAPFRKYGAHFWLNAGEAGQPQNRLFRDVPTDMFFAEGFDGQNIFIIPSRDLVVVRLGVTTKGNFDQNRFLKELLMTFP